MGFIGTTLAVAAGTILGDVVIIKIVTSGPAIEAIKEKTKEVVQGVAEEAISNMFNFKK